MQPCMHLHVAVAFSTLTVHPFVTGSGKEGLNLFTAPCVTVSYGTDDFTADSSLGYATHFQIASGADFHCKFCAAAVALVADPVLGQADRNLMTD